MSSSLVDLLAPLEGPAEGLPEDFVASVLLKVLGGPDGDATAGVEIGSGALRFTAVDENDCDVVLEAKWKDAVAIGKGELDPSVAYMQGRLKPSGRMDLVLEILRLSSQPEFVTWVTKKR